MKEIICKRTDCEFHGEMTCLVSKQVINKDKICISYKLDPRKTEIYDWTYLESGFNLND